MYSRAADRRGRSKSRFNIGRTSNRVGVAPSKRDIDSDIQHLQEKYTDITKIYNNAIKLATKQASPQPGQSHSARAGYRSSSRGTAATGQRQQDDRRSHGLNGRPQSASHTRSRSASGTNGRGRPLHRHSTGTGKGGGGATSTSPRGTGRSGTYKKTLVYSDHRTQVYSAQEGQRQTYRPQSGSAASRPRPGSASSARKANSGYAAGNGAAAARRGVRSGGSGPGYGVAPARNYAQPTSSTRNQQRSHSAAGIPAQYRQYNIHGQPVRTRSFTGTDSSSRRHSGVRTGSRRPPQDSRSSGGQTRRGMHPGLSREQSGNSLATAPARSSPSKPDNMTAASQTMRRATSASSPMDTSSRRPQSATYRLQGSARPTSMTQPKSIPSCSSDSANSTSDSPRNRAISSRKVQGNWTSPSVSTKDKKPSEDEVHLIKADNTEDTTTVTTVGMDENKAEDVEVMENTGKSEGRRRSLTRPDSALAMKRSRDLSEGGLVVQTHAATGQADENDDARGLGTSSSSLGGLLDNDEQSGEDLAPRDGTIGKSKQLGVGSEAVGSKWTEGESETGPSRGRSLSQQQRPRPRSATLRPSRHMSAGGLPHGASAAAVAAVAVVSGDGPAVAGGSGNAPMGKRTGRAPHPGIRSGGAQPRPKSAVARVQTQGRRHSNSLDSSSSTNGARNQVKGPVVTGGPSAGKAVASPSGGGRRVWASHSHRSREGHAGGDSGRKQESMGSSGIHNESVETMGSNPQSAPARGGTPSGDPSGVPPLLCPQASRFCDAEHERLKLSQVMRELVRKQGVSSLEFYDFAKVLGTGSFAKVREGFHKPTGSRVAVKTYDKAKIKDANQRRRIQQEIRLMEKLNHPRVVRHFEVLETSSRIHLVMECCGGGNLCSYLKRKRRLDEPCAKTLLSQILDGLKYMHSLNVVHRDIKLENVLIDEDGSVKLVDFGFSAYAKDKKLKIFCGTPSYMAPEIIKRKEYHGKPVDVWSLGVVLYAMVCGRFPFSGKSYSELYKNILAGQYKLPDQLSSSVRDLLRNMLVLEPSTRWTLSQIESHPWLKQTPSVPKHTPHANKVELVISTDPRDDIDESVIKRMGSFGVKRDIIISCMLRKVHNCVTTTYYLLRSALYNQHLQTSQFAKNVVTVS